MNTLKGKLGFKGERGYSAYEIAVQNGFKGTEEEWLDTLITKITIDTEVNSNSTNFKVPGSKLLYDELKNLNQKNEDLENELKIYINEKSVNLYEQIQSLSSGGPKGIYNTLQDLINANPDTGVYVIKNNGHLYSWTKNSTTASDLGVYQSTEIANNSVLYNHLENYLQQKIDFMSYLGNKNISNLIFKPEYFGNSWNGASPTVQTRINTKSAYAIDISKCSKVKYECKDENYDIGIKFHIEKNVSTSVFDSGWLVNKTGEILISEYPTSKYMSITVRNSDNISLITANEVANITGIKLFLESKVNLEDFDFSNLNNIVNTNLELKDNISINRIEKAVYDNTDTYNFKSNIWKVHHNPFVAHRGYSAIAPENTIPAFEEAGKAGFWAIETDLQDTVDGELVLIHNLDTAWSTGENLVVNESTYEQLKDLTIVNGNNIVNYPNLKIPRLEDFLIICKKYGCVPFLDSLTFVNEASYAKMFDLLIKYDLLDKCVFSALNAVAKLEKIRTFTDRATVILNISGNMNLDYHPARIEWLRNSGIGNTLNFINNEGVKELRNRNCIVGAWTIDDLSEAEELIGLGVDYIVSNSIPKF